MESIPRLREFDSGDIARCAIDGSFWRIDGIVPIDRTEMVLFHALGEDGGPRSEIKDYFCHHYVNMTRLLGMFWINTMGDVFKIVEPVMYETDGSLGAKIPIMEFGTRGCVGPTLTYRLHDTDSFDRFERGLLKGMEWTAE